MKSYTDLEQSKKLAEILPLESADMWYQHIGYSIINGTEKLRYFPMVIRDCVSDEDIPCWSLSALLDVLPDEVGDNHYLTLDKEGKEYCCCYEDCNGNSSLHVFASNPIDACVEMILKLKEKNLI